MNKIIATILCLISVIGYGQIAPQQMDPSTIKNGVMRSKNQQTIEGQTVYLYEHDITDSLYLSAGDTLKMKYAKGKVKLSSGSGGVTAVTATAPITSSGGLSPNIAIPQSGSSTNGYLSSTDWTTFNNKFGGSGTNGYLPYQSASGTLAASPIFRFASDKVSIGTRSGYNLIGRTGINIMAASPAFSIGKDTTNFWYHYMQGNNYEIYNPNFGAVVNLLTDGKMKMLKYSGSGNRYLYAASDGTFNVSSYDAIGGSGTGGYVARWFSSGVQDNTGLYCTAANGNNFGIGTTSPGTYGITAGGGIAIFSSDPRLAMATSTNQWIHYLSGTGGAQYNIYHTSPGYDVLSCSNSGLVKGRYLGFTLPSATTGYDGLVGYVINGSTKEMKQVSLSGILSLSSGGVLSASEGDAVIGNEITAPTGNGLALGGSGTAGAPYTISLSGKVKPLADITGANSGFGTNGQVLTTNGSSSSPVYTWTSAGSGTVTSVAGGKGLYALSSNPITSTGTIHSVGYECAYMSNSGISGVLTPSGSSYITIPFGTGNSTSNLSAFTLDYTNNEIDIAVSGVYEITYSVGLISNQSSLSSVRVNVGGTALGYTVRSATTVAGNDITIAGTRTFITITAPQSIKLEYSCSVAGAYTVQFRTPSLFVKRID